MKIYLPILIAITILSCEQNKPEQQKNKEVSAKDSINKIDSLNWDEIKINGEIPLITNTRELDAKLGKKDSISVDSGQCETNFGKEILSLFVKGVQFEINKEQLIFRSIDFTKSNNSISTRKITLNKNTSTADLQKFFPNSFNNQTKRELYGIGMVKAMDLKTNDNTDENLWILFFNDKKLIRMDYWVGCE